MLIVVFLVLSIFTSTTEQSSSLPCTFGHVSNGTHCQECGVAEVNPNVKIVGGVEALPSSWPYQILLKQAIKFDRYLPNKGVGTIVGGISCGGTLINHYTVITAAHCILTQYAEMYQNETFFYPIVPNEYYPSWESMFTITLGVHNTEKRNEPSVTRGVAKLIRHPNYNESNLQNDIAIFILSHPVEFSKYVKPACLPKEPDFNYPPPGVDTYAPGWGNTVEGANATKTLHNVKLKMYNGSLCSRVYPDVEKNWKSQICSGNYSGGQDTCQGDSGGGLYVLDRSNELPRYVLSGITSYGVGCARPELPGIYTRVSFYLDWIYKNWVVAENLPTTTAATTTTRTRPTTTQRYNSMRLNTSDKVSPCYIIFFITTFKLLVT